MNQDNLDEAFMRGMLKKAEEYGITKEAFLPTLIRLGGAFGGQLAATRGLEALAKKRAKTWIPKWLSSGAGKINTAMTKNPSSAAGIAANLGVMTLGDMAMSPIVEPLASAFEQRPQY